MDSPATVAKRPRPGLVPALVVIGLCLVPVGSRLRHPSLYSDDVVRIAQLRGASSLGSILFAPFNEHMAPAFQLVSWLTWKGAGEDLTRAPLAFSIAAAVPHLLCLAMLGALVRRETGSGPAALVATATLGVSGAITETHAWYSASSFSWALLGTLAALGASGRAASPGTSAGRRWAWIGAAAVAAFLAPAGSGIGLIAGPVAALRLLAATGASVGVGMPMLGTLAYLGVCLPFRLGAILARSAAANVDGLAALRNVARAPAHVLLPSLIGLRNQEETIPVEVAIAATVLLLALVLSWAAQDPSRRPMIACGLGLIVGGYTLAFGLRSAAGSGVGIGVLRYQLVPMAGLAILVGSGLGSSGWLARRPGRGFALAAGLGGALFAAQFGTIRENVRFYRWPEQPATLAAVERLGAACRREGITRAQCLASLPPVRKAWFDHDGTNALETLPPAALAARLTDAEARRVVLETLGPSGREALCGGMEVDPEPPSGGGTVAVATPVRSFAVEETGRVDLRSATGFASFLEFDLSADLAGARVLVVPATGPVEVWWSDEAGRYSEGRSVRWRVARSAEPADGAVPLADLPHWDSARVRRVRVVPRRAGILAAGPPRLLR